MCDHGLDVMFNRLTLPRNAALSFAEIAWIEIAGVDKADFAEAAQIQWISLCGTRSP